MSLKRRSFVRPTVVRTLGLPRDFQLVVGARDVRKADAQGPFLIRHRSQPAFRLPVRSVAHTLRAFVKWVLWRYAKWLEASGIIQEERGTSKPFTVILTTCVAQLISVVLLLFLLWAVIHGAYVWIAGELFYYRVEFNGWLAELREA